MKLATLLLFLPILLGAQIQFPEISEFATTFKENTFTDTIQVYALYLTDTVTGESKTARLFNERKGEVKGFWGGYDPSSDGGGCAIAIWKEYKDIEQSRFWLPNGEVVTNVLITWPVEVLRKQKK
jgi:hypothetical protein